MPQLQVSHLKACYSDPSLSKTHLDNLVTSPANAPSRAPPKELNAVNAIRVSLNTLWISISYSDSLQRDTFRGTVRPGTNAATVTRKVITARNVTSPVTQILSRVETARKRVISAKNAPSLVIILKSSVRTVIRVCWLASASRTSLTRTVGHTKVRCKEPVKEVDDGGFGAGGDTGGFDAPAENDDFAAPAAGGGDEWAPSSGGGEQWATAPEPVSVGGGGDDGW